MWTRGLVHRKRSMKLQYPVFELEGGEKRRGALLVKFFNVTLLIISIEPPVGTSLYSNNNIFEKTYIIMIIVVVLWDNIVSNLTKI